MLEDAAAHLLLVAVTAGPHDRAWARAAGLAQGVLMDLAAREPGGSVDRPLVLAAADPVRQIADRLQGDLATLPVAVQLEVAAHLAAVHAILDAA